MNIKDIRWAGLEYKGRALTRLLFVNYGYGVKEYTFGTDDDWVDMSKYMVKKYRKIIEEKRPQK